MADSKTIVVKSHKDIEALVEGWGGFRLYESFMDIDGVCTLGGMLTGDRKSLKEPHEPSGQIYRFLHEDYTELGTHRYALVTENGEAPKDQTTLDAEKKGAEDMPDY